MMGSLAYWTPKPSLSPTDKWHGITTMVSYTFEKKYFKEHQF